MSEHDNETMIYTPESDVDPVGDQERLSEANTLKNFAKAGSARASSLTYTYGPGSIMDLPHFTVMPMGLDDWDRIYDRRPELQPIHAPRLLESVQQLLGHQVTQLRRYPWQPDGPGGARQNTDLGVPARVFPQWLRCTGCNRLAPVSDFASGYKNNNPYRPDQAEFYHVNCPKRGKGKGRPCIPARYLLVCSDGHVDEFPYSWWVHHGNPCEKAPEHPILRMGENNTGATGSSITCMSCGDYRIMGEAQSTENRNKLPKCRGRFPHLNAFEKGGCDKPVRLMLIGASNLWFPVVQSIIDMPRANMDERQELYEKLRTALGPSSYLLDQPIDDTVLSIMELTIKINQKADDRIHGLSREELKSLAEYKQHPAESDEDIRRRRANWDPVDLLVPEWKYLDHDFASERHQDKESGLTVHRQPVSPDVGTLGVTRVLAVDKLRKVNATIGFTRIDDFDRVNDLGSRLVRLTRDGRPKWVPATEDLGEGVFIQFDEDRISQWEAKVLASDLWESHRQAHRRNYFNRVSDSAKIIDPDTRLPQPRYWLVHTFAHALIKRMAMSSGYSIPSLNERIYAWPASGERPAAAGVLIATTASDSDGTLGGLVALSDEHRFAQIMRDALHEMERCSSDPVCAQRVPTDPEDFLHGAACHCCCMLSETSCERANRFLDRRFLVPLPGDHTELAFFGGDRG